MKKFILLLSFYITSICAAELHIVAQGKNSVADAINIFTCLAYQGCETTYYTVGTENRLHIYTVKTKETVEKNLSDCNLSATDVVSLGYLGVGKKITPINVTASSTSEQVSLSPAIIDAEILKNLPQKLNNLDTKNPAILNFKEISSFKKLLLSLNNDSIYKKRRIEDFIKILKINTFDYKIEMSNMGKTIGAITQHGTKNILVNTSNKISELPRVMRHEYDHVLQWDLAKKCDKLGSFSESVLRERAAYLNDARFVKSMDDKNDYMYNFFMKQISLRPLPAKFSKD